MKMIFKNVSLYLVQIGDVFSEPRRRNSSVNAEDFAVDDSGNRHHVERQVDLLPDLKNKPTTIYLQFLNHLSLKQINNLC